MRRHVDWDEWRRGEIRAMLSKAHALAGELMDRALAALLVPDIERPERTIEAYERRKG